MRLHRMNTISNIVALHPGQPLTAVAVSGYNPRRLAKPW